VQNVTDCRYGKLHKAGRAVSDDVCVCVLPRFCRRSAGQFKLLISDLFVNTVWVTLHWLEMIGDSGIYDCDMIYYYCTVVTVPCDITLFGVSLHNCPVIISGKLSKIDPCYCGTLLESWHRWFCCRVQILLRRPLPRGVETACFWGKQDRPVTQSESYWLAIKGEGEGKAKGLDTCYRATYMSQTRDQQRFTISEVAADWHEPMVPQRIMWSSIARANGQLVPRCS